MLRVETRNAPHGHENVDLLTCPLPQVGFDSDSVHGNYSTVHALETKHQCFSLALVPTLRVGTYTAATHDRPYAFPRGAWERKCSVWERETRRMGMRTSICSHAHCRKLGLTATLFMATIQRFTHLRRSTNVSALHSFPRSAWERIRLPPMIDPMHSHAERGNENAPCGNEKRAAWA